MENTTLREATGDYLIAGLQAGWSNSTHRQYAWHLDRWRIWLDDRAVMRIDQITRRLLRAWGAGLRYQQWPPPTSENAREMWKPATVRIAVISVRAFLMWCQEERMIESDLATALKIPTVPRQKHRTLRYDEVAALLDAAHVPARTGLTGDQAVAVGLRNAAIVSLLYDSLLRASELCRLRIRDLDLQRRRLEVQIKGGAVAPACYGVATAERLAAWLAIRQAVDGVDQVFVSVAGNTPGHPLTTTGLRIIVRNLGKRAGVMDVSPHAFRRGGAVRQTELGAPTRLVKDFGRWSNLAMVELYTRDMEADSLYDEYSPVDDLARSDGHHRRS